MLSLLAYFLVLTLAAIWLAHFAEVPGSISMEWYGWEIETSVVFLIAAIGITLILAVAAIQLFQFITQWPSRWRIQRFRKSQEQGLAVLTEAFAAFAVADLHTARKLIRKADKNLHYAPLTTLLNAQLARMEGRDAEAATELKKLLSFKETQFLAARGLLEQARRKGDTELALHYAEQAEKLRPDSPTAALALVDLYTLKKLWQHALETIEQAKRHRAFTRDEATRFKALVFYQRAEELFAKGDDETALHFARQSHKLLPSLVPNTLVVMHTMHKLGMDSKIPGVIAATWKLFPHPSLATAYRRIYQTEKASKQLKRIEKLASLAPDNIESQIAIAEAALDAGEFSKARNFLQIALSKQETPRICKLMARLIEAENRDTDDAQHWLRRAVKAELGPSWSCESCQAIPQQWSLHCPECNAFDTIQWKTNRLNFVDVTPATTVEPQFETP